MQFAIPLQTCETFGRGGHGQSDLIRTYRCRPHSCTKILHQSLRQKEEEEEEDATQPEKKEDKGDLGESKRGRGKREGWENE